MCEEVAAGAVAGGVYPRCARAELVVDGDTAAVRLYADLGERQAVDVGLAPRVGWSTRVDAGFGGSNGTYNIATSIGYTPLAWLTLSPNAYFMSIDYENGEPGDSDWYLYDANEFGWGLSFVIHIK